MPYADPERQREANRQAQRRYRRRWAGAGSQGGYGGTHKKARHEGNAMNWDTHRQGNHQNWAIVYFGIEGTLTEAKIKKAYRSVMSTIHPDRCTGSQAHRFAKMANDARDELLSQL